MKRKIPTFNSGRAVRDFVDIGNLADDDLSGGTLVHFEFERMEPEVSRPGRPRRRSIR